MEKLRTIPRIYVAVMIVMVCPLAALAGPVYTPIGDGTSFVYNGIPFEYGGVSMLVIKNATEFIPSQTFDLSTYTADNVHIIQACGYSDNVPDGFTVGHINVFYRDPTIPPAGIHLVIGENTAEWAYDRPEIQDHLQHSKIPPAYSFYTDLDSDYAYLAHKFYVYITISAEGEPLDRLELTLDPLSYAVPPQEYYGYARPDFFGIAIGAITLEVKSHTPAPGALLLAGMGAALVGWMHRRRAL